MNKPEAIKAFGILMESDKNLHTIFATELLDSSWYLTTFGKDNKPLHFYNLSQVDRFLEGK